MSELLQDQQPQVQAQPAISRWKINVALLGFFLTVTLSGLLFVVNGTRKQETPVQPLDGPIEVIDVPVSHDDAGDADMQKSTEGESETLIPEMQPKGDEFGSKENSKPVAKVAQEKPFSLSPSLGQYQFEAGADPHGVPASLEDFARQMAAHMTKAKADESYALQLVPKLSTCAMSSKEVLSVRAVCAENARTLGQLYPGSLSDSVAMMNTQLDAKVASLLH